MDKATAAQHPGFCSDIAGYVIVTATNQQSPIHKGPKSSVTVNVFYGRFTLHDEREHRCRSYDLWRYRFMPVEKDRRLQKMKEFDSGCGKRPNPLIFSNARLLMASIPVDFSGRLRELLQNRPFSTELSTAQQARTEPAKFV